MKTKGELTKERILGEAVRLVNRNGVQATGINDLIAATGLKKGGLYFHFSSKDELTLAALENMRAQFMEFLDASLSGETPAERIGKFFERAIEKHRNTGFVGGCIWGNTALEMSDKDERYAALIKQVMDDWTGKIEAVVRDAQAERQARTDIPADVLATLIVAAIEGGIMLARLAKDEKPLRDCLDSVKLLVGIGKYPCSVNRRRTSC